MVKMLTVLVSTIPNSQVFWLYYISIYDIFNDQGFNGTLTNDIVSFEQLGPGQFSTDEDVPFGNLGI